MRRKVVDKWEAKRTEPVLYTKKDPPKHINRSLADLKLVYLGQIK